MCGAGITQGSDGETTGMCSVVTVPTVAMVTYTHSGGGDTIRCSGDTRNCDG